MTEEKFFTIFPTGPKNDAYAKYFVGQSYLNMLSLDQVVIGNVTFEPGCRNNWHIHHADKGGCLSPAVVATTRNGASLPVSCMPVM